MLIAAAVCPTPPLLVPDVAHGAAVELDRLRAACDQAVATLLDARPDRLALVGTGPRTCRHPAGATGDLAGFLGDRVQDGPRVRLGQADGRSDTSTATLPLSLTVGAWLLDRAGASRASSLAALAAPVAQAVRADAASAECAALGARLAAGPQRVGLLVLGDGSACRRQGSPGPADERAIDFDAQVSRALGAADADALLRLDPELAAALLADGRASWQVLAGAAAGTSLRGRLLYDADPYGVAYHVASWS